MGTGLKGLALLLMKVKELVSLPCPSGRGVGGRGIPGFSPNMSVGLKPGCGVVIQSLP